MEVEQFGGDLAEKHADAYFCRRYSLVRYDNDDSLLCIRQL